MMLVVIVHAGAVYAAGSHWVVTADESRVWITVLVDFLGLFDVEGFFVISGMFTVITAQKYGCRYLGSRRLQRLAIPLISTALVLNVPFSLYMRHLGLSDQPVFSLGYLNGGWVYHLWFLINLLIYTVFARVTLPFILPWAARVRPWLRFARMRMLPGAIVMVLLVLISVIQLGLVAVSHAVPIMYEEVLLASSPYSFLHHMMFFVLGMAMRLFPSLWQSFRQPSMLLYLAAIAIVLVDALVVGPYFVSMLLANLKGAFVTFALVQCIFTLFNRHMNQPSPVWLHLSQASYSVYLIHHPVVVLIAIQLFGVDWPVGIEFFLVLIAAFTISLAIHAALIRPFPIMRFLFNGKPPGKKGDAGLTPGTETAVTTTL